MQKNQPYPVGTPGQKWQQPERDAWLARQTIKRSYQGEVLNKVLALSDDFVLHQYGSLDYQMGTYPLFVIKSKNWHADKPNVLVTGGVHGYETSGVQGAIRFAENHAADYQDKFNILVVPCLSPWGYETINRWNPAAIDPNRSFYTNSPAPECAQLMGFIEEQQLDFFVHIDLHETTDTDNSEFRPALAARDGSVHDNWNIPDGFYLVGDTNNPQGAFQKAMIAGVEKVTHIAPPDSDNKIIGAPLEQWGVINYAARELGLCMGLTNAEYKTTTEVYPDSPKSDDENCILAQVAAITSGLDYVLSKR